MKRDTKQKRPNWLKPTFVASKPKRWCEGTGVVVATFKVPANLPAPPNKEQIVNIYPAHHGGSVCWWDGHEFDCPPVGCPCSHDERHNEFHLQGYFCSWACARAYGARYLSSSTSMMVPSYIKAILRAMGAANTDPPAAAPHWCVLKRFGGSMTIDEFRSLPQLSESKGIRLVVYPEQAHVFMSGFDCFLEEPRIKCPSFSTLESRLIKKDDDGRYVFPQNRRKADGRASIVAKTTAETQTPTTKDDNTAVGWAAGKNDVVLIPFQKRKSPAALVPVSAYKKRTKPEVVLTKPKPTAESKRRATKQAVQKCLKTTKTMKRALKDAGPQPLYRDFKRQNAAAMSMNIQLKKK